MGNRASVLLCFVLAVSQFFLTAGCGSDRINGSGHGPSSTLAGILQSTDMGQAVFDMFRAQLAAEPASPSRDAALLELDARELDFVAAINAIANPSTLSATGIGSTIQALYTLVDDGTLPALTDQLAVVLDDLAADPQALDAIVQLQSGGGAVLDDVPLDAILALVGRLLNNPDAGDLVRALSRLVDENDGVDAAGLPNGEPTLVPDLLSSLADCLRQAAPGTPAAGTSSQAFSNLGDVMLDPANVRGTTNLGPAEWVVRRDARGAPEVARDPATGRLVVPFVDNDGDGLADLDAQGRFVDWLGMPLDRPSFGTPSTPDFDAEGRAIGVGGVLLYAYVDAKTTVLALHLELVGKLVARGVHSRAREVLEAGLGPLQPGGVYAADGPVFDVIWAGLELLEPEETRRALAAIARVLRQDPDVAERILVGLSRAAAASSAVPTSTPSSAPLVDDLLALLDDLFDTSSQGSGVTETLADLATTAPHFATQLAPLFQYVAVERESAPDGDLNDVDESRSLPVDRAQPAFVGARDNRSAIHQLLDLLARADTCSTLTGQTMAEMIIDMMATQSPATVEFLIPLLTGLPGFLPNLFCPGISQDLQSLDALARSGALDALLPLARVFKDRGQIPLLLSLIKRVQVDYDALIRPSEDDVARQLGSGAFEAILEVLDLARQSRDPVTGETAADALINLFGRLIDDDAQVRDSRGVLVQSRMHLLSGPLRDLDGRLAAAGRTGAVDDLGDALFDVLFERVVVSGVERLRNGNLIPLLAEVMDAFARAIPTDPADRRAELTQAQRDARDAIVAPGFADGLALARTVDTSPSHDVFSRALAKALLPRPTQPDDAFGAIAKLGVLFIQDPPQAPQSTQGLLPFLARVIDPANPLVIPAIRAFERLTRAGGGDVLLDVGRAALNPPPGWSRTPATVLLDTLAAVSAASGTAYDQAALIRSLRALSDLLRDDVDGLGFVYQLIRRRRVR